MAAPLIRLRYQGNRLVVDPTTERIREILEPVLTATEKRTVRGPELYERLQLVKDGKIAGPAHLILTDLPLFYYEINRRLVTSRGFHERVRKTLKRFGYPVVIENCEPERDLAVYTPDFDHVFRFAELRYMQEEILIRIASKMCGRISCPPGYGKSFVIVLLCKLFPRARIHVVVKRLALVRQIYDDLMASGCNPGMVGCGRHQFHYRVTVISADSLHRSDGNCDILLGDEIHDLGAASYAEHLARYQMSRNYGLTASDEKRADGRDLLVEAIFGPLLLEIPYEEARQQGVVNDICVLWTPVRMKVNPAKNRIATARLRHAIWRNTYRNSLIAADANRYDANTQVLITAETIEHAVRLKKLLPDFTLVYAQNGMARLKNARETLREFLIRKKWLSPDEPLMTGERAVKLKRRFERGKLKKVIATTVWNVGVNFVRLSVLIRAEGGGSAILDTQIPGRTSRVIANKPVSIVHDYGDEFDPGMRQRALRRRKNYALNRWQQRHAAPLPAKQGVHHA